MNKEFIPYKSALGLKALGFNEKCLTSYANDGELMSIWNVDTKFVAATILSDEPDSSYVRNSVDFKKSSWCAAPTYRQAFKFFRDKYNFTFSIGNTNISVVHYLQTTQLLQDNATFEDAEDRTIEWFIDVAKQLQLETV